MQQLHWEIAGLPIIDLSNAANQPMHYLQRYTIIHNGEIY
jgi:asparagine synthase (glutamine-hydrolysing)